jgi:hypothetical protein
LRTGGSEEYFDLRGEKQKEAGENYTLRSLLIFTPPNRLRFIKLRSLSRTCGRGEIGNAYAILIGECDLKRPLGRYRRR